MRDLERYQRDYAAHPFERHQAAFRRRRALETLTRHAARRVLEVGCGLAPIFVAYRDFDSVHVVEPSPAFFRAAEAAARGVPNVQLHAGTLEDCAGTLAGESFDFILLSGLLHEVEDPRALLGCVRGLCGAQTVVHASVPNAHSLHRLLALEMGLIDDLFARSAAQQQLQQAHTWNLETFTAMLAACGFEGFESGTYFIKPFTHAQMAGLEAAGVLTPQMLEGLDGLSKHLPGFGSELFVNARRTGTGAAR